MYRKCTPISRVLQPSNKPYPAAYIWGRINANVKIYIAYKGEIVYGKYTWEMSIFPVFFLRIFLNGTVSNVFHDLSAQVIFKFC